jgi:hypothetical protein
VYLDLPAAAGFPQSALRNQHLEKSKAYRRKIGPRRIEIARTTLWILKEMLRVQSQPDECLPFGSSMKIAASGINSTVPRTAQTTKWKSTT